MKEDLATFGIVAVLAVIVVLLALGWFERNFQGILATGDQGGLQDPVEQRKGP